ncbi:MAG: SDR family NAD(P)-dependent oxidoreductase [Pseudorhodobacter sp.]
MGRAVVIGASGGIGAALAQALEARGDAVLRLSRRGDGLDLTDPVSVAAHLGRIEEPVDLAFIATGALEIDGVEPEKTLRALDPEAMLAQFRLNAIGPVLALRHLLPHLPRDRVARVGILSARVGSIGDNRLGGWYSYRAAKAALNQLIRTAAVEVARTHPKAVVGLLHPGTVATSFTAKYLGRHPAIAPGMAAADLIGVLERLDASDSGSFHDRTGEVVPW